MAKNIKDMKEMLDELSARHITEAAFLEEQQGEWRRPVHERRLVRWGTYIAAALCVLLIFAAASLQLWRRGIMYESGQSVGTGSAEGAGSSPDTTAQDMESASGLSEASEYMTGQTSGVLTDGMHMEDTEYFELAMAYDLKIMLSETGGTNVNGLTELDFRANPLAELSAYLSMEADFWTEESVPVRLYVLADGSPVQSDLAGEVNKSHLVDMPSVKENYSVTLKLDLKEEWHEVCVVAEYLSGVIPQKNQFYKGVAVCSFQNTVCSDQDWLSDISVSDYVEVHAEEAFGADISSKPYAEENFGAAESWFNREIVLETQGDGFYIQFMGQQNQYYCLYLTYDGQLLPIFDGQETCIVNNTIGGGVYEKRVTLADLVQFVPEKLYGEHVLQLVAIPVGANGDRDDISASPHCAIRIEEPAGQD